MQSSCLLLQSKVLTCSYHVTISTNASCRRSIAVLSVHLPTFFTVTLRPSNCCVGLKEHRTASGSIGELCTADSRWLRAHMVIAAFTDPGSWLKEWSWWWPVIGEMRHTVYIFYILCIMVAISSMYKPYSNQLACPVRCWLSSWVSDWTHFLFLRSWLQTRFPQLQMRVKALLCVFCFIYEFLLSLSLSLFPLLIFDLLFYVHPWPLINRFICWSVEYTWTNNLG